MAHKYRIRVGQEPPSEEPQKEQKLDKKVLLEKLQQDTFVGEILASAFTLGLAMALLKVGFKTKGDLKGVNPQDLASNINNLIKLVLSNKKNVTQELRRVWSLGPQKYIQRRASELRSL